MDYPVIDVEGTGHNLNSIIRNGNYAVSDIAAYLGTTESLVYRYMRGVVLPSIDRMLALSMYLNIPMNDLIVTIQ